MDKSAERGGRAGASIGAKLFFSLFVASFLASQFSLPINTSFLISLVIVFFYKGIAGVSMWLAKSGWSVLGVVISSLWQATTYTVNGLGRIIKRLLTKRKRQ